jgi:hypothetical protein
MANYILLESIELTQNAASITFDNLPASGYTDLKIQYSNRTNRSSNGDYDLITFNGTSIATARVLWESAGTVTAYTDTNVASLTASATTTTDAYSNNTMYIPLYRGSNNKVISIDSAVSDYVTSEQGTSISAVAWNNTNPITSITFTPRFGTAYLAGSTFNMYGVSSFGTTNTIAPKATGGNIVANDGTYWYHAFLTSGYFVPQTELTCDYLVVAGGGGGNGTGGGGGGGFRTTTSQLLSVIPYAVTVGAGGSIGTSGSNSSFNSFSATGGGKGRNNTNSTGSGGGSGGGGSDGGTGAAGNAGSYSPVEGFAGGASSASNAGGGGGGGGAVGSNGNSGGVGGGGGIGGQNSLTNAMGAATGTGQLSSGNYYYAGGGGGGSSSGNSAANIGGGGIGMATATSASNGVANTGGGGGGLYFGGSGAAGGSGIIIIRYAMV